MEIQIPHCHYIKNILQRVIMWGTAFSFLLRGGEWHELPSHSIHSLVSFKVSDSLGGGHIGPSNVAECRNAPLLSFFFFKLNLSEQHWLITLYRIPAYNFNNQHLKWVYEGGLSNQWGEGGQLDKWWWHSGWATWKNKALAPPDSLHKTYFTRSNVEM